MPNFLPELQAIYDDYGSELREAERKQKPADGLFGIGSSVQNDPCHMRFDDRVRQLTEMAAASQLDPEEAEQLIQLLFTAGDPIMSASISGRWMLYAAERHILPLIPFLSADAAARLCKAYGERYRPWDRLPAQKEVFKALRQQGRQK